VGGFEHGDGRRIEQQPTLCDGWHQQTARGVAQLGLVRLVEAELQESLFQLQDVL
jgi:hypothetical protein